MAVPPWERSGLIAVDRADALFGSGIPLQFDLPSGDASELGAGLPVFQGNVEPGDLLLAAVILGDTPAWPTGFTQIASVGVLTPSTGILFVAYKLADGSEEAIEVGNTDSINASRGLYARIRAARILSAHDGFFDGDPVTTTSDTGATLTPSTSAANLRIVFASCSFTSDTFSSTDTEDRWMGAITGAVFTDGIGMFARRVSSTSPVTGGTYSLPGGPTQFVDKTVSFLISVGFAGLQVGSISIG